MSYAQSIGVRAGLNYSTFSGPLEKGESFGLANGIHFGINYGYKFTNKFMIRAELQYNQVGTKQKFKGDSYYLIYTSKKTVFEKGERILDLEISNSYINVPITAVYQVNRKFELFGGISPGFLINPTGRGTVKFTSKAHPTEIIFKQALDYRYYQDEAKAIAGNSGSLKIIENGEIVSLPKSIGAYYQTDAKNGSQFNWLNLSVVGGVNFFINKGFFIGGRVERGLLDVSNDRMDFSITELKEDLNFNKRTDKDLQLSYQVSLGFKF
jgi:hypothetical protein